VSKENISSRGLDETTSKKEGRETRGYYTIYSLQLKPDMYCFHYTIYLVACHKNNPVDLLKHDKRNKLIHLRCWQIIKKELSAR
jgi:hypothetical protein